TSIISVATSPSMASFQWRYLEGSVRKSIRRLPSFNVRSASAMVSSHQVCATPSFSRVGSKITFAVITKEVVGEIGDHAQRRLRRFPVRRVACVGQQRDLDRAVAFFLRHLDLPHRAVLVVFALYDQHRHADVGE